MIADDRGNPMLFCKRGIILGDMQQHERAIEDLTEALRLDPDLPLAYRRRGELRGELGEYEAAIADFRRALSLDASSVENHWVWRDLGKAYAEIGKHDAAVSSYDRSIELWQSMVRRPDPDAVFLRGISNRALHRYDDAIRDFSSTIEQQPRAPWG